jgi:hypothetical protein
MSEELRLYFFDPRPEELQTRREAAFHQVFDNKDYWHVAGAWDEGSTRPNYHFNLVLRIAEPFSHKVEDTPALLCIMKKLEAASVPSDVRAASKAVISEFRPYQEEGAVLDLSITLPDGKKVMSSSGENSTINFNYEFRVRHDATQSQINLLEKLQTLEYHADLRLKFASVDRKGRYVADAREEYASFFENLPSGWMVDTQVLEIETRSEGARHAWVLAHDRFDVGAVEHETGVEILVAVGVSVASAALYDLIRWGLKKWTNERESLAAQGSSKAPTLLEVERIKRTANGEILSSETIKVRSPIEDPVLQRIIEDFLRNGSSRLSS